MRLALINLPYRRIILKKTFWNKLIADAVRFSFLLFKKLLFIQHSCNVQQEILVLSACTFSHETSQIMIRSEELAVIIVISTT